MPLSQTHPPRPHRSRRRRRHAGAARAAAGGRRAARRPPLLPAAGRSRSGTLLAGGAALLLTLLVAARAGAFTHLWDFLDFGAGVLSLVSLTATVLWGLVATDRVVLDSGHRLLAQGVHRGLAVAGLGFLALHIWVKVAEGRTGPASVVLPFSDADRPVLIGLGTLAGYLFVSVAVSGAVRSAFATRRRSLLWRALHMGAYPAWGASLVHGLKAGRAADAWVTVAYALCLAGVAAVLAHRARERLRGAARAGAAAPPGGAPPAPPGPPRSRVPLTARPARRRTSVPRTPDTGPRPVPAPPPRPVPGPPRPFPAPPAYPPRPVRPPGQPPRPAVPPAAAAAARGPRLVAEPGRWS
ncbi:hypothetical protein [Streptomyces sp. WAC06614]|uniref:hypothetical protein n=1 Tax=Streptomyces sp. WAC06614 TaxID=2487416 RepID=UPI00163C6E61|nr:hypothetical protein [Streptomyces sp. WAC06614]